MKRYRNKHACRRAINHLLTSVRWLMEAQDTRQFAGIIRELDLIIKHLEILK